MFGAATQNGVGVGIGNIPTLTSLPYATQLNLAVAALFANGENGAWLDYANFAVLWQESTKTTQVTAVEQPNGYVQDSSGRGNNATQATGGARPTVTARVNGLTKSEVISHADWTKSVCSAAVGSGLTIPSKYAAYSVITATPGAGSHYVYQSTAYTYSAGSSITVTAWFAKGTTQYGVITDASDAVYHNATFDLIAGTVSNQLNAVASIVADENNVGFYVKLVYTITNAGAGRPGIGPSINSSTINVPNYTAGANDTLAVTGVDIRPTNSATAAIPTYQRVDTASSYTTAGFPQGDRFNGSSSNMASAAGGAATALFFFCAAVIVGKTGANQTLFSDTGTNTGWRVRINSSNKLELAAGNGTAYTTAASTATLATGQLVVLTAWADGANLNVQINQGAVDQTAFTTATAGSAGFTVGCDNGAATSFFLGVMPEVIYRTGAAMSAAQIAAAQRYCAAKGNVTL